jgi:hypothetical protein
MGVLFICDTAEYSCAYGSWNNIRMGLLSASLQYVRHLERGIDASDTIIDSEKSDPTAYKAIQLILKEKDQMTDVDKFIKIVDKHGHNMVDGMNYLNIGGLWAIMNKRDDEGNYTPGNALDILVLIKHVESFVEKKDIRQRLHQVKKVLNHSVTTRQYIKIW